MKTVILAGGLGTRIAEESGIRPKPMIEIGGSPILLHILKGYAHYGMQDFIVALGYKGEMIKDYFTRFAMFEGDLAINLAEAKITRASAVRLNWIVNLIETGDATLTGGRLLRLKASLLNGGTFMLTYGDGVSDVNVADLLQFHRSHGKAVTLTAVRPPARFGTMAFSGDRVTEFLEKPQTGEGWINGGFFVMEPRVFDYLKDGDATVLEGSPLESLARDGELMAFRHEGFWQCMDTLRDKNRLEEMWSSGKPPWKVWQ